MITRREVIASGLVASALAHTAPASLAGLSPATDKHAVSRFVADERFLESRAAASAAQARGAALRWVGHDVTPIYEWLDLAWRRTPFALAGVTTNNAFFVIERLAWARGLRTTHRGVHRQEADGSFRHELRNADLIRHAALTAAPGWGACLGEALTDCEPRHAADGRTFVQQTLPGLEALVSWQLVPRHKAGPRV